MNSRFLISVLCVGAVAFACGPRPRSDAPSASRATRTNTSFASQQGAPRVTSKATKSSKQTTGPLDADLFVRASDGTVRLALHVSNTSKKRVELTFPSGQTYDFVILDSLDREVWRWARGRMFTQALRNRLLSAGESLDFEETWEAAALPPGRYTARAILTSENHPVAKQASFTVAGTTIASR